MTVQEAQRERERLEHDLRTLLDSFTERTGLQVDYVHLHRADTVAGRPVLVRVKVETRLT